jgi:hypothetical protein
MSEQKRKSATANPENYFWIMSEPAFMYMPTRTLMESGAVTQQVGLQAAKAIKNQRACSNLTWAPGSDTFLKDKAIVDGIWFDHPGNNLFNTYRAPAPIKDGDPAQAGPWLDLGAMLWGDDLPHMLDWLAFKVQFPAVKINHSLVLGSREHGLGKDSWLAAVHRGVGRNNWGNIGATAALDYAEHNYTSFLRKSILRVSEVHDLGAKRFKFYELTKDWGAAPPETITVADKHVKAHPIANVVGVIYTTNHLTDGVHIDPKDRRHFVAWSERVVSDFAPGYWGAYWRWLGFDRDMKRTLEPGQIAGDEHVAAFLMARDLSAFDPFAPPPKTAAWQAIVSASAEPQDAELLDVLDRMGDDWIFAGIPSKPDAVTMPQIATQAKHMGNRDLATLFSDPGKRRAAAHRLDAAGFASVTNPNAANGYWTMSGSRMTCYARADHTPAERLDAVRRMVVRETEWHTLTPAQADALADAEAVADFGPGA